MGNRSEGLITPDGLLRNDTPLAHVPREWRLQAFAAGGAGTPLLRLETRGDRGSLISAVTAIERYHLARRSLNSPYTITCLIQYPSASLLPDEQAIRQRVLELQDHFALLNARIVIDGSGPARWEERSTLRGSADIFERATYTANLVQEKHTEPLVGSGPEEWILERCGVRWEKDESLWRIRHYVSDRRGQEASEIKNEKAYMAVSVAHELMDGIGLVKLVQALLADNVDDLPYEQLGHGRSHRPPAPAPWTGWASKIAGSLMTKGLSSLLGSSSATLKGFRSDENTTTGVEGKMMPTWPHGRAPSDHLTLRHRIVIHRLDESLVKMLKSLSAYHGVPILTPVLQIAFLAAVQAVIQPESGLALSSVIPVNERDSSNGDEWCTGQHTSAHLFHLEPILENTRGRRYTGPTVWGEARRLAYQLAHPSFQAEARENIRRLESIGQDHTGSDSFRPHAEAECSVRRDALYEFLYTQAQGDKPFPQSVSFSNIGKVDMPIGADGVTIAGTCAVGDPPFEVVLSGTNLKGLVAAVSVRDGAAVQEEQVRRVLDVWERVLRALIVDGKDVNIAEIGQQALAT